MGYRHVGLDSMILSFGLKGVIVDRLVNQYGEICFGLINEPVNCINHMDYALRTPMGRLRSSFMKKFLFKQFSFIGINAPEFMAGVAVVDLKYAANGFFYVYEKNNRTMKETTHTTLPFRVRISPFPEQGEAVFKTGALHIRLDRHHVFAESREATLDAELMSDHAAPLRICTRTGFRGWTFTRKSTPIPVSGKLTVSGQTRSLNPETCFGIADWTAGYLRRETFWNWAAAAAKTPDGHRLGFNFSCGVNETGVTENAFWIDNHQTKVDTVQFFYDGRESGDVWRILSADGKVTLEFKPLDVRGEHLNVLAVASRFSQFVGCFSGFLVDDMGHRTELVDCPGWTEEHFARW